MSLLNSTAINEVILEQDILSTSGKVQSIWDMFKANVNTKNEDNDLLQLIVKSIGTKVIDKLDYRCEDVNLSGLVASFQSLVDDVCKNTDENILSVFLLALANSLSKSFPTKNQSSANIEINMTESYADMSLSDQIKTVSLLERHGLLDSNQLQSLLDDRSLALTKACTELGQRLDTPIKLTGSGDNTPPLGLKDFISNFDKIMEFTKNLYMNGVDQFSDIPQELGVFLAEAPEHYDERRLYHPKNYPSNVANSKFLNATNTYLMDVLDMEDASTMIYGLSSIDSKLQELSDQIGQKVACLVYSQIIVKTLLLKIIKKENADILRGGNSPTSADYIKYTHAVERLVSQIEHLVNELDNSSVFVKTNLFRKDQMDEYVDFVRNSHSWDAEGLTYGFHTGKKTAEQEFHFDDMLMNMQLDGILSEFEDISNELAKYQLSESAEWEEDFVDTLEALSSPLKGSEQAIEELYQRMPDSRISALVVENGKSIHSELNQCLLDGNLEGAANSVAREMALEAVMDGIVVKDKATMAELQSVKESIRRDVSTYTNMLNHSVSGGISKYEESASSYIADVMKTDI